MRRAILTLAIVALGVGMGEGQANAGTVTVYVGYADSLRANAFFPNPWFGSANTIFQGGGPGTTFDSGAVLIWNQSGATITVNSMTVSGFTNGAVFNNGNVGWGSNVLVPNGDYLIMTGYNDSDFDTSDQLPGFTYYPDTGSGYTNLNRSSAIPQVALTINGVQNTYSDSGQILNTGGFDSASWPYTRTPNNESLQWRPIGTTSFTDPGGDPPNPNLVTPEPTSLTLVGLMSLTCAGYCGWRRRKPATV
jgi:hypothetical protein